MATIENKTARQLIDDVASLIDIQLTDNTTPSRLQVVEWINRAVIEIFRFVPAEELRDAMVYDSKTSNVFDDTNISSKMLRLISLKRNGVPATLLTEDTFNLIKTNYPNKYTIDNPAYTRITSSLATVYKVWPSGVVLWELTYIPYPFLYETGDGSEEDEIPTSNSVPSPLEGFVVDYAAAYARIQDEEPGQFQLYIADWRQRLQMIYGVPASTLEGNL